MNLDGYGCPEDRFLCRNSKCLPEYFKCDGKDHCGDNSDEEEGCIGSNIVSFISIKLDCNKSSYNQDLSSDI